MDEIKNDLEYYLSQISNLPLLTQEEEMELAVKAKNGDKDAVKKLVEGNLRFVVSIAKNYLSWGVPFVDLISAGNLGLIEATKRFEPDKNVKFITYAIWWIKQSIIQTIIEQIGVIRIPIKQRFFIEDLKKTYEILKERLNREPTIKELARELGVSQNKIINAFSVMKPPISIESLVEVDNEELTILDTLSNYGTDEIEEDLMEDALNKVINRLLEHLNERERKIIELRYGLTGEEPKTLTEVGKIMKLSRERVRQIEQKALHKMKRVVHSDTELMIIHRELLCGNK